MGISRRAYAASRGISESAVRRYIADGKLAEAIEPDGTINASKANALLARSLTRAKNGKAPAALRAARARKDVAVALANHDALEELKRWHVVPVDTWALVAVADDIIADILRQWPARIAPTLAGKSADVVHRLLKHGIDEVLGDLYEALGQMDDGHDDSAPEPDFARLTPVEIRAVLLHQDAERLELQRHIDRGNLVPVEDIRREAEEANAVAKSRLVAIPGRLAELVAIDTAEQAEARILAEVEGVIAALRGAYPHRRAVAAE